MATMVPMVTMVIMNTMAIMHDDEYYVANADNQIQTKIKMIPQKR